MSDLQSLAKEKAAAEMQRKIAALPGEIEAMKREHAAIGLLRSGATLKRILAICKAATEAQRVVGIEQYKWAMGQALFVSQSWVERLVSEATQSLEPLHHAAVAHFNAACEQVGKPELVARLLADLEPTESAVRNDIALALRSGYAERRRGLVRSLPSLLPKIISRIFGGGAI